MAFPAPQDFSLVVAAIGSDGEPDFLDAPAPSLVDIPGVMNGAWYWKVAGGHSAQNAGGPVNGSGIAGPDGSTFGVLCFPAHSAGKMNVAESFPASDLDTTGDADPAMHASKTIDYEVVLSGKVDIELPGGKVRTLHPGSLLVMAGVPHAWKNHYDEDCVYIAVTVGFQA
jgi:hypothetical protein